MNLVISDFDGDRKVTIPLQATVAEDLLKQVNCFSQDPIRYEREIAVFVQQMSDALIDVLKKRFERPLPGDVKFAMVIACALRIDLPGDALDSRVAMNQFLNAYAPKYHEQQIACRAKTTASK